jgi:hypothetical protein
MTQKDIIYSYNKTAKNYAANSIDEIKQKTFDRIYIDGDSLKKTQAKENAFDWVCGPGQTTKFLFRLWHKADHWNRYFAWNDKRCKKYNPHLSFEMADIYIKIC